MASNINTNKIIMLSYDFPPIVGGISTYAIELAQAIHANQNFQISVLAGSHQESPQNALPFAVERITLSRSTILNVIRFTWRLHQHLGKHPDAKILCTNWYPCGLAAIICLRLWRKKNNLFISAHGAEVREEPGLLPFLLKNRIRRWVFSRATKIFPVSRYTAQKLEKILDRRKSALQIVPNGVNTKNFFPKRSQKSEHKLNVALSVCRLEKHKGIDTALHALAICVQKKQPFEYWIAGSGPDRTRLQQLAKELNVEKYVHFWGRVTDSKLFDLYNSCDFFLLLSRELPGSAVEGFGLAFLEAAACGKTAIGTLSGGIPDAVIDGQTGLLIKPDSAADAAEAILWLTSNPKEKKRLENNALHYAHEQMSWQNSATKMERAMDIPPKICFLCISTHLGGAEQSLLEYLRFIKKQNYYVIDLVLPKKEGPLVEAARNLGIEPKFLLMPLSVLRSSRHKKQGFLSLVSVAPFLYLFELIKYLRENKPDIVHTTGIKCHVFAAIAAPIAQVPVLWHLRDHLSGNTQKLLNIVLKTSPGTSVVANSISTAQSLGKKHNTRIIYNGLNPNDFPFQRSQKLRQELGLPTQTKIIGILGVLAKWKGQAEFIKMAAHLIREVVDPPLHFVIVGDTIYDTCGDSGYKEELRALVDELGITPHISFLGFRPDSAQILQGLDVLVHASIKPEPFGRVIVEAMASGTPVTASAAGGPLEIIEPGKNGLLHTPSDIESMAKNVKKLLEINFSAQIRSAALETFLRSFTNTRYNESLHNEVKSHIRADARSPN